MQIHFTPDSNVRTAPPAERPDPRAWRTGGLARSLLFSRLLPFALLASVSQMSACIIPVAPSFQDPPSTPDSPPYLSNFSPKNFNDIVTVPVPAGQVFSATVSDPDVSDPLNVRWVVDYPPFTNATRLGNQTTISPGPNGQPINQTVSQTVDCNLINPAVPPPTGSISWS